MCEASCAWLKTTQSVNFCHFKPSGRKLITRLCPALLLPAHQFLNCHFSAFMQTVCHCLTTRQVCLRTKLYTVQQWIVLGGLNREAWSVMTWWCSWCCYDWVNASSLCVMLLEFEIMLDCATHTAAETGIFHGHSITVCFLILVRTMSLHQIPKQLKWCSLFWLWSFFPWGYHLDFHGLGLETKVFCCFWKISINCWWLFVLWVHQAVLFVAGSYHIIGCQDILAFSAPVFN